MRRPGDRQADPARPPHPALPRHGAAGDARAELLLLLGTGDAGGHLTLEHLMDRCGEAEREGAEDAGRPAAPRQAPGTPAPGDRP